MSRNNIDYSLVSHAKLMNRIAGGVNNIATSATINLASDAPLFTFVNAGAALNLVLPAPSTQLEGRFFYIFNVSGAANTVTIKQNDGTTTLIAPAQGKSAMVVCDGTTWRGFLGA